MAFTGQLNSNEIFSALFNMIISQEVFADNIKGSDLVDKARVDGTLYGDTKLYYSTDALQSHAWGNDAEAANLLAIDRPSEPEVQAIELDTFRQIRLTVDNYLTKRAFMDEGAFSSFNGIMLGWMKETKKVYDGTNYNVFIGTTKSEASQGDWQIELDESKGSEAQQIAESLANLITEMTDYNREFNDYGQLRRYSEDEIKVVFNAKYINKIKNIDLPVIFNNSGLKATFDKDVLPARYFGTVKTEAGTANGTTHRAVSECVLNDKSGNPVHYFAGDIIKKDTPVKSGEYYVEDDKVVAKVLVKYPPYMSAFEVGTSFFNPRSLTENHYLTFGHNTLEYLKAYPFITVHIA